MSTQERAAEDQYEAQNDANPPVSADVVDNDYKSRTGQSHIPVVSDEAGNGELDDNAVPSNSDEQLQRDDHEAIDTNNIIESRTRGAKPTGSLSEGPDEDDLPTQVAQGDAGQSSTG